MILRFKNKKINGCKLQKICEDRKTAIKALGDQQARSVFKKIRQISFLEEFDDLFSIPYFEELSGNRKGDYSLRITANYRLILTKVIENNRTVLILNIEDYH